MTHNHLTAPHLTWPHHTSPHITHTLSSQRKGNSQRRGTIQAPNSRSSLLTQMCLKKKVRPSGRHPCLHQEGVLHNEGVFHNEKRTACRDHPLQSIYIYIYKTIYRQIGSPSPHTISILHHTTPHITSHHLTLPRINLTSTWPHTPHTMTHNQLTSHHLTTPHLISNPPHLHLTSQCT